MRVLLVRCCLSLALLATAITLAEAQENAGPKFRVDGPMADEYGAKENYPACAGLAYIRQTRCRVGAFSSFGTLFPSRRIVAPPVASPLPRAATEPEIRYRFEGNNRTLEDYLNSYPITGFMIAKGDTVVIERYQYGRSDKHLLTSFSMAKSILGLLIGKAIEDGSIRSIDDPAEAYVPELKGTLYGRASIKSLLLMSSGVEFREVYADPTSDIYVLARMTIEQSPGGGLAALKLFNAPRATPGFSYSSADSVLLGLVLSRATGRPIAEYASDTLWKPLGAESEASWNVDATGQEVTYAYFNAVLRDWTRLGLMLAHRGRWAGREVISESWIAAATTPQPDWPSPTYGYHIWISPFDRHRFLFSGLRGQYVFIDPETKLVLVQTALDNNEYATSELTALWMAARAQLR